MIFDYETLKLIWWVLIGVLLIGFVITDGFDMGVGALLPFLGRNDDERRVIINTIGPHWDGNQVWFITAGGAIFAAWPAVYAAAFSGFYIAMLLVLFALFFRPVGFDYRSKIADPRWRTAWDWGLFAGGAVPALLFGVAFGNLLLGVPFAHDEFLRPSYSGSFWGLLHPFALLSGVLSLAMLVTHGAVWLQLRTEAPLATRARAAARIAVLVMMASFALAGIWLAFGIDGYRIVSMPPTDAQSNPLIKVVEIADGAWLNNYDRYPWMILAPVVAFAGGLGTFLLATVHRPGWAFITSALSMAGVILTAAFSMFPFILPSSTVPNSSLTVWDAPSSHLTLMVMFWAAALFVPLILMYTLWSYRAMWGKVTVKQIQENTHSAY
ncbi:cytochrome d ubiquinol oxidase subunit II [Sedimenticola hydrogenitrophicus]|uniref:cytochrome d ubiquinol oxidase subunit II n=1 Tax=Sedimenticola hydrogenitrophicus TaxID=2967975 RepID=UPI0023B04F27|nr:cytochrome d ubiquinol oxidase subunit II [Sedimenticola hydrogenitrophicus]